MPKVSLEIFVWIYAAFDNNLVNEHNSTKIVWSRNVGSVLINLSSSKWFPIVLLPVRFQQVAFGHSEHLFVNIIDSVR